MNLSTNPGYLKKDAAENGLTPQNILRRYFAPAGCNFFQADSF